VVVLIEVAAPVCGELFPEKFHGLLTHHVRIFSGAKPATLEASPFYHVICERFPSQSAECSLLSGSNPHTS